jgi:arylsulfatase A-like enzyme
MQKIRMGFWRSLSSIVSVFLVAGLVDSYLIYSEFGETLIPSRLTSGGFLLASYAIYFCAGVLIFCLAWLALLLLRRIWPFKGVEPLVSILSMSVAAFSAAYLFDYILQNILGNPLSRIDILFGFLGAIFLFWLILSFILVFILKFVFQIDLVSTLPYSLGTLRVHGGVIAGYIVAGLFMSPGTGESPMTAELKPPNVWLISVDTLRADRLSSYGYQKNRTPNIDRLAGDGVIFENAFSPDHWTLPAHASLFTSLSPDVHGVNEWASEGFVAEIPRSMDTIASQLSRHGYMTIGTVDNDRLGYLGASRNFDRGFDYYGHYPIVISPAQNLLFARVLDWIRRPLEHEHTSHMVSSIMTWLGAEPKRPYFFFLHLYDVHAEFDNKIQYPRYPYYPLQPCADRLMPDWASVGPPALNGKQGEAYMLEVNRLSNAPPFTEDGVHYKGPTEKELESLSALYDCGISLVDEQLGQLFDRLRQLGEYDNSIIILTSDHGEGFYEHKQLGHWNLYDELLRVPLIIKPVQSSRVDRRRSEPVSLLDVAPTIFDLVGAPGLEIAEGMSLAPLVSEFYSDAASEEFVDRVLVGGSLAAHKHLSLHYRDHKIIRGVFESGRTLELYNVKRDRREKINLAGFEREILAQYSLMLDEQTTNQEKLAVVVAEKMGSSGQKAVFTNFMEENLKALGYVE